MGRFRTFPVGTKSTKRWAHLLHEEFPRAGGRRCPEPAHNEIAGILSFGDATQMPQETRKGWAQRCHDHSSFMHAE